MHHSSAFQSTPVQMVVELIMMQTKHEKCSNFRGFMGDNVLQRLAQGRGEVILSWRLQKEKCRWRNWTDRRDSLDEGATKVDCSKPGCLKVSKNWSPQTANLLSFTLKTNFSAEMAIALSAH